MTCKLLKHISIGLLELIMFFEYRSLDILFFILHFINCKPFMFGIKSMTFFPALKGGGHVRAGYKVTVFPLLNFFPALKRDIKCFAMHGRATTGQFT